MAQNWQYNTVKALIEVVQVLTSIFKIDSWHCHSSTLNKDMQYEFYCAIHTTRVAASWAKIFHPLFVDLAFSLRGPCWTATVIVILTI